MNPTNSNVPSSDYSTNMRVLHDIVNNLVTRIDKLESKYDADINLSKIINDDTANARKAISGRKPIKYDPDTGEIDLNQAAISVANMSTSNLSASQAVMTDADKKLVSTDYLNQAVKTTSSVTHAALSISRMNFIPSTATLDTDGFVTITSNYAVLDTFEGAASDDLNKITMAGQVAGDIIIIRTANAARDITIKNGAAGGNIVVVGGDRLLPNTDRFALLLFDGTNWNVIVCNENAT